MVEKYQARVEDCHSDDSDGGHDPVHILRKQSPTAQANVSTKRSKDLNADKTPAQDKTMPANIDLRSDSGYSSFTAASKSSADSAPSASSRKSPPVQPTATAPQPAQSPAPRPRRPTASEHRQHSNENSPRQKPSRTASVSSNNNNNNNNNNKHRPPPAQRRPTLTQERAPKPMEPECRDPKCTTCGPNVLPHRRRPDMQPSASTRTIPTYQQQSDQMSQRSDPNPYYSPPSPTYTRQAAPYGSQGPAFIQTARTRRSSSTTRPRPQSFAGEPGAGYWNSAMPPASSYPTPPQDARGGPPLSYYNQNMPPYGAPAHPYMPPVQQQGPYYPPSNQTSPPYDHHARPSMPARNSTYGTRSFPAPIITQEGERPRPSARHGPPPTPIEQIRRAPQPKPKLLQYGDHHDDDDGSETESSEEEEEHDVYDEREARRNAARALMPPPKLTKRDQSQRRPILQHANTDRLDRRDARRQSIVLPERPLAKERGERERERDRAPKVSNGPTRRASVSRPPPPHRQTRSQYDTPLARVVVNDSRTDRRRSYQVDEKAYENYVQARAFEKQYIAEQKREKRASRVFVEQRPMPGRFDDDDDEEEDDDDDDEEEEERIRVLSRPRKNTYTEPPRKGKDRVVEQKDRWAENAEEYIKSTRGSHDPFADSINKAALKKASRMSSLPSDSGSSQSNGSGKASHSNRTTMTSATNNEIRLRVNGTQPLSLQLSGDMEGRTLQLVPAGDGMTDLVIGGGNQRGNETSYRSERGSTMSNNHNRRSIVAGQGRRDAEDASERSSRSGYSRRERDEIRESRNDRDGRAPVLRRSRHTTYH